MRRGIYVLAVLVLIACAAPRPVLYPNPTYERVGARAAERDIDECIALAEEFKAKPPRQPPEGVAGDVIEDTTVGAATGAAVGAVVGNPGRGAGAGAAGGAASSIVRRIFRGSRQRESYSAYHVFVERCLMERGYEIAGWN